MKVTVTNKIKQYSILFLVIWIAFLLTSRGNISSMNITSTVQSFMKLVIVVIIFIGSFLLTQKKNKEEILLQTVVLIGLTMRIGYMLYTPCTIRQHDLGLLSIQGGGHAGYILHLLEGRLPSSNHIQYYHPPLFHALAAGMIKITRPFLISNNIEQLIETAKIVSCYASCLILLMTKEICKALNLKERATLIVVAQIAFLPNFYLLAGRINNDALAIFFVILIILYTIKWYEAPKLFYMIALALGFGLGMMTKLSVGMLALFTGSIMLLKLIESIKQGRGIGILKEYVFFGVIAIPLALWYPIRNYICFKQPLMYVYELTGKGEDYCGNLSFFQRFIEFDLTRLLSPIYNNPHQDKAAPMYLLKGALFGEFSMRGQIVAQLLIITHAILCIATLVAIGYFVINYRGKLVWRIGLPSVWTLFYIAYIGFNIRYPYTCTMDYRYIVPTAILGAIFVGITSELIEEKEQDVLKRCYMKGFIGIMVVFSLLSISMYCNV